MDADRDDRFAIVLVTAGSQDEATRVATTLVERGLAACVSIVDGVTSVYRWKGVVQTDRERLLVIKTRAARFAEVAAAVREIHAYEVPEIVMLRIDAGERAYLDWLGDSVPPA